MPPLHPVHYKLLVALFERDGFAFERQRGGPSHLRQRGARTPVGHPSLSAVPVFIIKNLLRTAGMSRERYFELLESV